LQTVVVRDFCDVPRREAAGIAVVATSNVALSAVQISVEIKLFTRVVLVDRLTTSLDVVNAVLDAVDGSRNGIFGDSYRVAKAPTLGRKQRQCVSSTHLDTQLTSPAKAHPGDVGMRNPLHC
jgi:hypothetical protein